jgi:hypothetical protein
MIRRTLLLSRSAPASVSIAVPGASGVLSPSWAASSSATTSVITLPDRSRTAPQYLMTADTENSLCRAICISVFSPLTQMSTFRTQRMDPGSTPIRQSVAGALVSRYLDGSPSATAFPRSVMPRRAGVIRRSLSTRAARSASNE